MGRHITHPESIFSSITEDYQVVFGKDLVGVILYGSAAGPDFQPGSSDVNFMIVLTEAGMDHMERALDSVARWRKRGVALPLFLTEAYVRASLDVFPIEYLGFARQHVRVFGKDILDGLEFKTEFLRLQCEREIKGKLLLLREAFLDCGGKGRALRAVIKEALPALTAVLQALLHLKGIASPQGKREVVRAAAAAFGLETGVFEGMLNLRERKAGVTDEDVAVLFKGCLRELQRLSHTVDSLA